MLKKRTDGSSVKELYVPEWHISFFQNGAMLGVRQQPDIMLGTPVRIIIAHAILLHNLYMRSKDYSKAGEIAKDAFATYITGADDKN